MPGAAGLLLAIMLSRLTRLTHQGEEFLLALPAMLLLAAWLMMRRLRRDDDDDDEDAELADQDGSDAPPQLS